VPEYKSEAEPLRGYRALTDEERSVVDEIKRMEERCAILWAQVADRPDTDQRCVAVARTSLQDSFMWFVRSVTKPRDVFQEAKDAL
jgi:hypothetical protein